MLQKVNITKTRQFNYVDRRNRLFERKFVWTLIVCTRGDGTSIANRVIKCLWMGQLSVWKFNAVKFMPSPITNEKEQRRMAVNTIDFHSARELCAVYLNSLSWRKLSFFRLLSLWGRDRNFTVNSELQKLLCMCSSNSFNREMSVRFGATCYMNHPDWCQATDANSWRVASPFLRAPFLKINIYGAFFSVRLEAQVTSFFSLLSHLVNIACHISVTLHPCSFQLSLSNCAVEGYA